MNQDVVSLVVATSSIVAFPLIAYFVFKGTAFDISFIRDNPWPLIWYGQVFLILFPLIVVSARGIENIQTLYTSQPGQELDVALITVITLFVYIISLGLSFRMFKLSRASVFVRYLSPREVIKIHRIAFGVSLISAFLLLVFYWGGYKHAFLFSIIENTSVLYVRLSNKYDSSVPSQLASILMVGGYMVAALGGYLGRLGYKRAWIYLWVAIFILAAPGDKAPLVKGLLVWLLAKGSFLPKRTLSFRAIAFFVVVMVITLGGIYLVLQRQIPNLNAKVFADYLLNRIGVGQMAGMYETYSLYVGEGIPEGNYFWHILPGAKFFVDYIDYQKALMMYTEGYGYSSMGVKNTYFVAEALAIGGLSLALVSPLIVAFSYALGLYIYLRFSSFLYGKHVAPIAALPIYILSLDITGGFSPFPLLKAVLLLMLQTALLVFWWPLLRFFLVKKPFKTTKRHMNRRQVN